MPVYTLNKENELQEVTGTPDDNAKNVTYGEKPWVVIVAPDLEGHPEFCFVYGPYATRDEAQAAITKLVVFTPYHIAQCEEL